MKCALVVAAIALVAGCSGSEPGDKADKPSPEKVYSAKELSAALPTLDEIPNGRKLRKECPGAKDCVEAKNVTDNWSVDFELAPADNAPRQQNFANSDVVFLSVSRYDSEANATAQMESSRDADQERDGSFDIKATTNADGAAVPGQRGEGTRGDVSHGEWSGFRNDRHLKLIFANGEESEPRQEAGVTVAQGRYRVSALVSLGGNFEQGAAMKLADRVVADYLKRLG